MNNHVIPMFFFTLSARVLNCFDRYSNEVPQIMLHYQAMNRKCKLILQGEKNLSLFL
ncbi:hypothetical protein DAI22_07g072900 [Oryza sativa Japonica Group]|nr:hypothetical protein DAI22_07g072900 [Oryza sativa Japonica Group]